VQSGLDIRYDRWLLWATLFLVLVGMVTVYTASVHVAEHRFGGSSIFLRRNALRVGLGLLAMAAAYFVDYRWYRKHARRAILSVILLLAMTLLFGKAVRGSRAWLLVQPSELAKLALVIYLADVLVRRQHELRDFLRGVAPRLVLVGVIVALVLAQPDFGSALAIVVLSFTMLFLAGVRLRHIVGLGAAAVPAAILAVKRVPHIAERCAVWRETFGLSLDGLDTQGAAYQIYQSLVALGSGGFAGRGVGSSVQRGFIPDPYTDFAFSIWGEELGLLGSLALIGAFTILLVRGFRTARRSPDLYGTVLAGGLTAMITTYAVINVAVATATMPTTGLPLPFISYGGSSLIVNMAAVGILLNISKRAVLTKAETARRKART